MLEDDHNNRNRPLLSLRLLIVSVIVYISTFFIGILGSTMGFSTTNQMSIVFYCVLAALCMNIVGVVIGIIERKRDFQNAMNGIIGNLVPILLVLALVAYLFSVMSIGPM